MDIFHEPAKTIPTSDKQIVRVNMEELEIGGRKSHLPGEGKSGELPISHVPNSGTSK